MHILAANRIRPAPLKKRALLSRRFCRRRDSGDAHPAHDSIACRPAVSRTAAVWRQAVSYEGGRPGPGLLTL